MAHLVDQLFLNPRVGGLTPGLPNCCFDWFHLSNLHLHLHTHTLLNKPNEKERKSCLKYQFSNFSLLFMFLSCGLTFKLKQLKTVFYILH